MWYDHEFGQVDVEALNGEFAGSTRRPRVLLRTDGEVDWLAIKETPQIDWLILVEGVHGKEAVNKPSFVLRNAWVGMRIEKQVDTQNIPALLRVRCRHFLLVVPRERIDLFNVPLGDYYLNVLSGRYSTAKIRGNHEGEPFDLGLRALGMIDWVIVTGEDRPIHPYWLTELREQCAWAQKPFYFETWGEWSPKQRDVPIIRGGEAVGYADSRRPTNFGVLSPDGTWYEQHTGWNGRVVDPDTGEAFMVRVGKSAGRALYGKEYLEFPKEMAGAFGTVRCPYCGGVAAVTERGFGNIVEHTDALGGVCAGSWQKPEHAEMLAGIGRVMNTGTTMATRAMAGMANEAILFQTAVGELWNKLFAYVLVDAALFPFAQMPNMSLVAYCPGCARIRLAVGYDLRSMVESKDAIESAMRDGRSLALVPDSVVRKTFGCRCKRKES